MDSIWNLWNYVEYVESTWNLWGSVKYTQNTPLLHLLLTTCILSHNTHSQTLPLSCIPSHSFSNPPQQFQASPPIFEPIWKNLTHFLPPHSFSPVFAIPHPFSLNSILNSLFFTTPHSFSNSTTLPKLISYFFKHFFAFFAFLTFFLHSLDLYNAFGHVSGYCQPTRTHARLFSTPTAHFRAHTSSTPLLPPIFAFSRFTTQF